MATKLDADQVLKHSYLDSEQALQVVDKNINGAIDPDSGAIETIGLNSLVPKEYDEIALTYVGAGLDGEGQVATAQYRLSSSPVATLTLSYDSSDRLVNVVRT